VTDATPSAPSRSLRPASPAGDTPGGVEPPPADRADEYSPDVRRLFAEAPGAGAPADAAGWLRGEAREPLTATHVRWYLRTANGRIAEARYEVRGCPHTVAAAALAAERLRGRPVDSPQLEIATIVATLGVPSAKLGRLFVIEDAVRAAVRQAGAGTA
jgi:NifU-like protein involved in Fe-S cluster formation